MRLRDFFRRHKNVFSISAHEVCTEGGDEDMLVEDYGELAVEARRGWTVPVSPAVQPLMGGLPRHDVSEDEIQDGDPPPAASR